MCVQLVAPAKHHVFIAPLVQRLIDLKSSAKEMMDNHVLLLFLAGVRPDETKTGGKLTFEDFAATSNELKRTSPCQATSPEQGPFALFRLDAFSRHLFLAQ